MAKECTIYYATVVDSGDDRWASLHSKSMEPVKVEGREPFGKKPQFCCTELEDKVKNYTINFYYRQGGEYGLHIIPLHPGVTIRYCPFCGAKIVFKEHLKLKVIEIPVTRSTYHYEVVK